MWHEPYLETCCRSALHRVVLAGPAGRPAGLKDGPCLQRLCDMGSLAVTPGGRFVVTAEGADRHRTEVMRARDA